MEEIKDVTDPRFEKHIRKKLLTLFTKADLAKSGSLDYDKFVGTIESLNFGLAQWDLRIILAILDKNGDGFIKFNELHDLTINLIMCALLKKKAITEKKDGKAITKEDLGIIYGDEIAQITQILTKKFKVVDAETKGTIPKENLKAILTKEKLTTIKERNLLVNNFISNGFYEYKTFADGILEIRHRLVVSSLQEMNFPKLEDEMMQLFKSRDTKNSGFLSPQQIKDALLESNFTNLTLLQIYSLIGVCNHKGDNRMNYKEFVTNTKGIIQSLYGVDGNRRKLEMRRLGKLSLVDTEDAKSHNVFELFGVSLYFPKLLAF